MRVVEKRLAVSRRTFIATSGAATAGLVALTASGSLLTGAKDTWAVSARNLGADAMHTLVQMARDIYPHDRLADKYYAAAVAGYDDRAGDDADLKSMIVDGVTTLDGMARAKHGDRYVDVGWESDRTALLVGIQDGAFFQKVRGGLVTGIYNNPEVWRVFGYEGPSADRGGYIDRGFDDLDWI